MKKLINTLFFSMLAYSSLAVSSEIDIESSHYKSFLENEASATNEAVYGFISLLVSSMSDNTDVMFDFKNKDDVWNAYQNFALYYKNNFSHEKNLNRKHFKEFSAIAHIFLEATYKVINNNEKNTVLLNKFKEEIRHRYQVKKLHYKWLVVFLDRLTIWLREYCQETGLCENAYIPNIAPKWDRHRFTLRNQKTASGHPVWHSYQEYKKALKSVHTHITKEFYTSISLTKYFPHLMLLPMPMSVDILEMNINLPSPDNPFALVGFSNLVNNADGYNMPSDTFLDHDIAHWATLILTLSSISFMVHEESDWQLIFSKAFQTAAKKYHLALKKCFYTTLKLIHPEIEAIKDEEKKLIFRLFLFEIYHEPGLNVYKRIDMLYGRLFCRDFDNQTFLCSQKADEKMGMLRRYLPHEVYGPFLPASWHHLNNEEITARVKNYLVEFRKLLSEKARHDKEVFKIVECNILHTHEEEAAIAFQIPNKSFGPTALHYAHEDGANCEVIETALGTVRIFREDSLAIRQTEKAQIRIIFNDDNPFGLDQLDLDQQDPPVGGITYEIFISKEHPDPELFVETVKSALGL